jgi:hypothetical protein
MENQRPQGPTSISRRESIRGEGLVGRWLWWKEGSLIVERGRS